MLRTKTWVGSLLALGLVVSACAPAASESKLPGGTGSRPTETRVAGALVEFDACDDFLDHVISHAVDLVGPYGLDDPIMWPAWAGATDGAERAAEASTDAGSAGSDDFSQTNVQVEGVDEPDIVKTDGTRIVVIAESELIVLDVSGDEPVEVGRMSIGDLSVQSLFLSGDEVLLFGSVWSQGGPIPLADDTRIAPVVSSPTVRIVEVDISAEPKISRTMTIDGTFVSGRMVDDSVRLVLTSGPVGFEWSYPSGSGLRAERQAIEENRRIVRDSTAENWIPYYVVTNADGDVTSEGTLFDCERASHPEEFSGLNMLSVVTIDLSSGLDVVDATGVLATGDTVYASPQSLFVATRNWETWRWMQTGDDKDRPDGPVTEIHMFDISDPSRTSYVASGSVDGFLLGQFSMDEHDGMLRVASTTSPNWWGSGPDSESRVTILRPIGAGLVRVGSVDGLGATEQIYAVRFMGDVGYVVTFRQTDPLYTLDLSDPRSPRLVGELKIPGYSAYLHPIGDDLILGVGQDATDDGQIQGTQVSVFDVSDLSAPRRLDTLTLGEGTSSQAEYDHHAFLFWNGLGVIPFQEWSWEGDKSDATLGAIGFTVDAEGRFSGPTEIVHPGGEGKEPDWRAQVLRTVVVGDSVYTISAKGIMKSSLDSLETEAWVDF